MHPEISMAGRNGRKETNFFLFHHERGPAFYEGWFDPAARVWGEACPDYTVRPFSEGVAERIARMSPEARLVYLVRDPVDRVISHWRHAASHGRDPRPFAKAVGAPDFPDTEYVLRSRYWWQLEPFLALFGPERIRVVLNDDLKADPAGTMQDLFRFAGVDADAACATALPNRENLSGARRRPPRIVRALLLPGATATAPPPSRRRARLVDELTRRFGRPLPEPRAGPVERARIWELVRDDVAALADHLGRPLWGVAGMSRRA
jgi:hypothetical protein